MPKSPPGAGDPGRSPLDVEAIRASACDLRLGHPLIYLPTVPSTNTYAAELARAGAAEGTLVTTDDQTAGRGRIGRVWRSLPGRQLALSLVLRPTFPPHFLVMASALAVAGAIDEVAGLAATIKWPNDVLVDERKVSGILIETSAGVAILGIGINVNGSLAGDTDLSARATTLADATGRALSREAIAIALLRRLNDLYALMAVGAAGRHDVWVRWRARLATLGRHVTVRQQPADVTGMAEDVDDDGALLIRLEDGTLSTITWGDVSS